MDGQPPDESVGGVAHTGNARPLQSGTQADQLIATIVKLLAGRVAREIIDGTGERP